MKQLQYISTKNAFASLNKYDIDRVILEENNFYSISSNSYYLIDFNKQEIKNFIGNNTIITLLLRTKNNKEYNILTSIDSKTFLTNFLKMVFKPIGLTNIEQTKIIIKKGESEFEYNYEDGICVLNQNLVKNGKVFTKIKIESNANIGIIINGNYFELDQTDQISIENAQISFLQILFPEEDKNPYYIFIDYEEEDI